MDGRGYIMHVFLSLINDRSRPGRSNKLTIVSAVMLHLPLLLVLLLAAPVCCWNYFHIAQMFSSTNQ